MLEYQFETADIAVFLTLILLEGVLSLDNAAILAAMTRQLPVEQRRKALLYGLVGAYVFRTAAIFLVFWIAENPIIKFIGGGYLVFLAVKHLAFSNKVHGPPSWAARIGITGFWAVVIQLEVTDLVFALDQVLVAVAMTDKIVLIIAASLVAILLLRLSALYMGRLMDWFPQLEKLAYVAVGLVGFKLLYNEAVKQLGFEQYLIPKPVTVAVTLALLVVPVLVKLVATRLRQ